MAMPAWSRMARTPQVAAVCYRRRGELVEFLLVHTRRHDKWTFPKGGLEPSLSPSRAAEKEAWEEAGVRGAIQSECFHSYIHAKRGFWGASRGPELRVEAFLLAVEKVHRPQEQGRSPTWFASANAREVLAHGRDAKYAREIQTVIDRALAAIGEAKQLASIG